jgi:hypothetical protein
MAARRHGIMSKLRVVAGTDVGTPALRASNVSRSEDDDAVSPRNSDQLEQLIESEVLELFERYQEARRDYDRAMGEVAKRTGRDLRTVAGKLRAVTRKRNRSRVFEPTDWCDLM